MTNNDMVQKTGGETATITSVYDKAMGTYDASCCHPAQAPAYVALPATPSPFTLKGGK
jgi:hypothetical protein